MGLKDLFHWRSTKTEDDYASERPEIHEDYEAHKDDVYIDSRWAGSEADRTAADDLDSY
jgi:hypothetical protein